MSTGAQATALPPLTPRQWRMYRGGLWLIILAESMIFVTLFSTRFLLAGTGRPEGADPTLATAILVLLAASVVPAHRVVRAIARGDAGAMSLWAIVTAIIGAIVLAIIVYDWSTLDFPAGGRYGENYVLATGYHAVHIVFGLIWLAAVASAGRRGRYSPENYWAVEAGVYFWYFVSAVWLALYIIFFMF